MEINELPSIVLTIVMVAMVLATGLLIFDNLGSSVRDTTRVTNETCTQAAGSVTLDNIPLVELISYGNSSKGFQTAFNCVGCKVNYTSSTGVLTISATYYKNTGTNYKAIYDYYENTTTTNVLTDSRLAISTIGTSWLPLLVTMLALALVLGLIMRAFGNRR